MKTKLEILDGDEWVRLLVFAAELPGVNYDGNGTRLGIRIKNILAAAGWTQFLSTDYERACSAIQEHYDAKLTASPAMTEEQAFHDGETKVWYSTANLIDMARAAHKQRHNNAALRGYSMAYGRSAKRMADAVEWWSEWFATESPRAQTPQDCLILFALAGLGKEPSQAAYLYWVDHSDLSYFQVLEFIAEIKAQFRLRDFGQYGAHKRGVVRGLGKMQDTAKGERQGVIQGVIETVRSKL